MGQLLYNLVNWQYFWIVLIIFVLLNIAWFTRWGPFLDGLQSLWIKPIVIHEDKDPHNPKGYPRLLFEQLAGASPEVKKPAKSPETVFEKFIHALEVQTFDANHPYRIIMSIVLLIVSIILIWADFIVIANTLNVMGLWPNLPEALEPLEIAVFAGASLGAIIGFFFLSEIRDNPSEYTKWSDRTEDSKQTGMILTGLVIIFSVLTLIALAVERLVVFGMLASSPTLDFFLQIILYGVALINITISAALCTKEALPALYGVLSIFWKILVKIAPFIMIFVDIAGRILYTILGFIIWFITTAALAIPMFFVWLYRIVFGPRPTPVATPGKRRPKKAA